MIESSSSPKKEQEEARAIKDISNINPTLKLSKSLYDMVSKSPGTAISSIAALFIVVILAIVIPSIFANSSCECSTTESD